MKPVWNKDVLLDQRITEKIASYPQDAKARFLALRKLILDVAKAEELGEIEETLKWGEPSFKSKTGSPVRIDWKSKNPEIVSLFFSCNTKLVATFREVFPEAFEYEGNREIKLPLSGSLPTKELTQCIGMALNYHKLKSLPLLGA